MSVSADDTCDVSQSMARELLVDLVSIPSPSGEEAAAAERLRSFFEAHGREVWIDDVGNVRAPADDAVLLTSHIDTVPGEIPVEIETLTENDEDIAAAGEDVLWGRGSVDATGPLASLAVAAVRTGASFAGVVGEETNSRGAWNLIDDRAEPEAVINGEPSGATGITLGYRGFLSGTYVSTSESGHSSRPDPNAIQHAIGWWSGVESAFEREEYEPVFEQVTAKPVSIDGGISDDGLSIESTLSFQLRVPPSFDVETVRETAESELHRRSSRLDGTDRDDVIEAGTISWDDPIPPVMQSPRTEIARAFRVGIRNQNESPRLLRKTGTSDMNIYASEWSCPMVTYGPGNSELDHAPDERLSLAEYELSIAVLDDAVSTLVSKH